MVLDNDVVMANATTQRRLYPLNHLNTVHDTATKRDGYYGYSNASTKHRIVVIILVTDNLAPDASLPDGGWWGIDSIALYNIVQSITSRGS